MHSTLDSIGVRFEWDTFYAKHREAECLMKGTGAIYKLLEYLVRVASSPAIINAPAKELEITKVFSSSIFHFQLRGQWRKKPVNLLLPKSVLRINVPSRSIFPLWWHPCCGFPVNYPNEIIPASQYVQAA